MKRAITMGCLAAVASFASATVVDTIDTSVVSAFQSGITVNNFESIAGLTAQSISAYTQGDPIDAGAFLFNQIAGAQFSVGGSVGTNTPALFKLSGGIAADAKSGSTVLGPVDFDFTTKFGGGAMLEIFFPTKVSKVGFWLNPSLGNVLLIAADTNFAFSGLPETTLESGNVTAGRFVGIEHATADIGGFKVIGTGGTGFTIDDFSFGTPSPVPEPASVALFAGGLAMLGWRRRRAPSVSRSAGS